MKYTKLLRRKKRLNDPSVGMELGQSSLLSGPNGISPVGGGRDQLAASGGVERGPPGRRYAKEMVNYGNPSSRISSKRSQPFGHLARPFGGVTCILTYLMSMVGQKSD